jgi:NarL family two-component system response regulator LiaR
MKKIKILIADNSYLIRTGFRSLISPIKDFSLVGEASKAEDLNEKLLYYRPDVLVIDYASRFFCLDDIAIIHQYFPEIKILAITYPQSNQVISKAIQNGVMSHLLKDSTEGEIIEAIYFTAKGQQFICGKINDLLLPTNKI